MLNSLILLATVALACGQGTNNGQNNVDCVTCGQGNGQNNINDPAVQDTMAALSQNLPFLDTMGLTGSQDRQNLECPTPKTFFLTTREEPACTTDSDCTGRRQICCNWFGSMHCLTGIATGPKDGTCPAEIPQGFPCKADFAGCRFDSECSGTQKCCENSRCSYFECAEPVPSSPVACTLIACPPPPSSSCVNIGTTFPNGPQCASCRVCNDPPTTTTQPPQICTKKGCGLTPPGPNCRDVRNSYPNGPNCEPPCPFCADPVTTPPAQQPCTRRGCGLAPPGPNCRDVRNSYPNGPNCEPPCPYCADPVTTQPPQICTRRGCGLAPPGPNCRDVRNSYPNGPNCEPPCPYCADTVTTQPPQVLSALRLGSCVSNNLYFRTVLNDCRKFDLSMSAPSTHAASLASPQMCSPGTIFDLKICGCNHISLVNVPTCSS